MNEKELCKAAIDAMKNAYVPYSGYRVGAALMTEDGKLFTGCNIENAAYTPTVCAERTAFFNAISSGERDFAAIAVAGGKDGIISGSFPLAEFAVRLWLNFALPILRFLLSRERSRIKSIPLTNCFPKRLRRKILKNKNYRN